MKTITNKLKLTLATVALLAVGTVSAQTTDASDVTKTAQGAAAGPSIKLIDNKGTIKYMQSNNGITTITSTAPGNRTVTTWQLGGTLIDDTFINATGQVFGITGIKNLDATANPVTDIAATAYNGTGYTIMVRDEASGEIKKVLASELLQVQSGRSVFTAIETGTPGATEIIIATAKDLTNSPTGLLPKNVSVYRNGAKLLAGTDYTLANNGGNTLTQLTLVDQSGAAAPSDWTLYAGDIIEIHWVR